MMYLREHQYLIRGDKLWAVKIWTVINMALWPVNNQFRPPPPIILPTKVCGHDIDGGELASEMTFSSIRRLT